MISKIIADLLKYLPSTLAPALIAFVSIPIFTRIFSPTEYGNLSIVRTTIDILWELSCWVGIPLVRYYYVYEKENRIKSMVSTIVKSNFVVSFFITGGMLIIITLLDIQNGLKYLMTLGLVMFNLQLIFNTLANLLRIRREINMFTIYSLFNRVGSFFVALILIYIFNFRIESILLAEILILILLTPILWAHTISGMFSWDTPFDVSIIKQFAVYGIPLSIGNIGSWALKQSDRYIIKLFMTSGDVGIYSSCYNITWNVLFLIVTMFYMMEQPLGLKVFESEGDEGLRQFVRKNIRLFLIVIVPIALWVAVYAQNIFTLLVGSEFRSGVIIVPFVAASAVLFGLVHKFTLGMIAKDKTQFIMMMAISSGVVNVILNVFLVPHFGIIGAAWNTLISYLFYFVGILIISTRVFPFSFPIRSSVRILMSSFMSIIPVVVLRPNSTSFILTSVVLVLSVVIYLFFLMITGEVTQNERGRIYNFFKKV